MSLTVNDGAGRKLNREMMGGERERREEGTMGGGKNEEREWEE